MSRKNARREDLNADITPLIDIVFLLLIFFMVTSVFKKDDSTLLLTLPDSQSKERPSTDGKNLMLELSQEKFVVNKEVMNITDFEAFCQSVANKLTPVDLRIDKEVKYDRIVKVLDALQKHELTNLSLITKAQES